MYADWKSLIDLSFDQGVAAIAVDGLQRSLERGFAHENENENENWGGGWFGRKADGITAADAGGYSCAEAGAALRQPLPCPPEHPADALDKPLEVPPLFRYIAPCHRLEVRLWALV